MLGGRITAPQRSTDARRPVARRADPARAAETPSALLCVAGPDRPARYRHGASGWGNLATNRAAARPARSLTLEACPKRARARLQRRRPLVTQRQKCDGDHNRLNRSRLVLELALRPASSAPARRSPTAQQRARWGAGATGCDCGAGALLRRRRQPRGSFASTPNRSQGPTLLLLCESNRGTEG